MGSCKIQSVVAREILDSRDNPTVETTVFLESGDKGTASVPSGASLGKYEALELRDNDPKRYGGMGVLRAMENVNTLIAPKLQGQDAKSQKVIDKIMLEADATPNKKNLGANSILSVSLATAVAAANAQKLPLYHYLNQLFTAEHSTPIKKIPTPTFNVINGGKHGAGNLDFQEFHVIPASNNSYSKALQMGVEIYDAVKQILIYRNIPTGIGDEGGFAPNLFTNLDAIAIITDAIRTTPYRLGRDVFLGLDLAASHFKKEAGYRIKDQPAAFTDDEFIAYLTEIHHKYPMLLVEDPLGEDDWDSWKKLTEVLGREILIIGDDLLATNPERLKKAVDTGACSAILLKPNQIGTLSEFFAVATIAKQHDIKTIVSHRSGETNDTFIADLAVAIQSDYIKFGAPVRGERVGKYNRLLEIESNLCKSQQS